VTFQTDLPGGSYTLGFEGAGVADLTGRTPVGGAPLADFTVVSSDLEPPTILGWYSVAVHLRDVGEARLEIPDTGLFSEPRVSGITKLVVVFSEPIDPASFTPASVAFAGNGVGSVSLDLSAILVSTSTAAGDTEGIITFSAALPDIARYLVQVDGVRDVAGNALAGDNNRVLTGLIGDTDESRRINVFDLANAWSNQTLTIVKTNTNQVRSDVDLNGRVNVFDLSATWAQNGHDARTILDPVLPSAAAAEAGATAAAAAEEGVTAGESVSGLAALAAAVYQPVDALAASSDGPLAETTIEPVILATPTAEPAAVPAAATATEPVLSATDETSSSTTASLSDSGLDSGLVDALAGSRLTLLLSA